MIGNKIMWFYNLKEWSKKSGMTQPKKVTVRNVILDLDNTILHSVPIDEIDLLGDRAQGLKYIDMENYYRVFSRPDLDEFLDFLFEHFDVTVWTAGSLSYCMFIIRNVILVGDRKDKDLKLILYDKNCEDSQRFFNKKSVKHLNYLFHLHPEAYDMNDTILIDDNTSTWYENRRNVLLAPPFDIMHNIENEHDFFLRMLMMELIKVIPGEEKIIKE